MKGQMVGQMWWCAVQWMLYQVQRDLGLLGLRGVLRGQLVSRSPNKARFRGNIPIVLSR